MLSFFLTNTDAAESPISASLIFDTSAIGVSTGYQSVSRTLTSVNYQQDFLLAGGTLTPQINYALFRGANGSTIAQDVQGFSNIDAPVFSRFQEVAIQWQTTRGMFRVGQLDANANFVALTHAAQFMNSSFGFSPTAYPLATYPQMTKGLYLEYWVSHKIKMSYGYYAPAKDSGFTDKKPLMIVSACWLCSNELSVKVGYWQINNPQITRVRGAFLFAEGKLNEQLSGFALVSSNNHVRHDKINQHIKFGVTFDNPFAQLGQQIGIAYSRVNGPEAETVIEAFYVYPLNQYVYLQPDVQWHKDALTHAVDPLISTLRVVITW